MTRLANEAKRARVASITGHRRLDHATWVREALAKVIAAENVTSGITSLAAGADQLFAECLAESGLPYSVVVPSADYLTSFDDNDGSKAAFARLLAGATAIDTLDFNAPSNAAFMAAGQWLVDKADLLIAVWDGALARGPGGTGDVVAYARTQGRRVVHIHSIERRIDVLAPIDGNSAN